MQTSLRELVRQRLIQSVNLEEVISVIFASQVSQRLRTVQEMKYTSQHCCDKNNGWPNGLISRMLFSVLYKIIVNKVNFSGFTGRSLPWISPCHKVSYQRVYAIL